MPHRQNDTAPRSWRTFPPGREAAGLRRCHGIVTPPGSDRHTPRERISTMDDPRIYVRPRGDDGFDLVCRVCGQSARGSPDQPIFVQVRCFLERHRHDA